MVAAEAVQRAQAGDEVGDLRAGTGDPGLLLLRTRSDPFRHDRQDGQDRGGPGDDERPEPQVGESERDGGDEEGDDGADEEGDDLDDVGGLVGVLGGDGEDFAGLQVDVAGDGLEAAGGDLHAPAVRLGGVGLLEDAHTEPPRQGDRRDDHGERGDGDAELVEAAALHRVFDDEAERDREGGLPGLVEAHEEGAAGHRADVAAQRGAQDVGPGAGLLEVRSCHRGGGQSLRGCAG
ncbi:hypothetical protein Saa2_01577 [Streptomyces acidiscabies]|nr:hypothetical protein Saa2_01577 [Streptomyces acidiscabies]